MITPFGRNLSEGEEERMKEEKNAVYIGHLVLCQCRQAAQANNMLRGIGLI
jgi:hypothetical protein